MNVPTTTAMAVTNMTTVPLPLPLYSAGHVAGVAIGAGLAFLLGLPLLFYVCVRLKMLPCVRNDDYGSSVTVGAVVTCVLAVVGFLAAVLGIGLGWGLNSEFCCT